MIGPSTADELREDLRTHGSIAAVARHHGVPRGTIQSRVDKWQVKGPLKRGQTHQPAASNQHAPKPEPQGVVVDGDTASIILDPGTPFQPEQLLRDHGLDPDEWIATNARPNSWNALAPEGKVVTLHQLKVEAKRRIPKDMWLPARTDATLRHVPAARRASTTKPLLVALVSDQHCPHQDPGLEACWLAWVEENQPDRIVGLGDLLNLSKPHAKHRPNLHAKHNDAPKECYQAGHDWWRRTLLAAGSDCEADQIAGNHDVRTQIACLERMPELYDVCRPGEEHPWWDLEHQIGFDKLGVTYHRAEGEYHAMEVELAPGFSVAHGAKAGPHGGAAKDIPRHEGSRAVGHDHKAGITYVVRYRNGQAHQHVGVSVGTMARRDLGYQPDPDTCQGFATLVVHSCGYWNVELARYDDRRERLVWRDQLYAA